MMVADVSDPESPRVVGGLYWESPEGIDVRGVAVAGNYAYVIDNVVSGLVVADVAIPSEPRLVGFGNGPLGVAVAVAGNYAYVASLSGGLNVVDISNPSRPRHVGCIRTPGAARDVAVVGSHAYVAAAWGGLRVLDVSTPWRPREVGFYDTPGDAYGIAVGEDGLVYVADWTNVFILDASEAMEVSSDFDSHPSSFILLSAYPNPFNTTTKIHYNLQTSSTVILSIYDPMGREIIHQVDNSCEVGNNTMFWSGIGANGMQVASGSYFVRLQAGPLTKVNTLVLVR
jgi:uncharacterized secreted protein with C-terminal beta-propeller domain